MWKKIINLMRSKAGAANKYVAPALLGTTAVVGAGLGLATFGPSNTNQGTVARQAPAATQYSGTSSLEFGSGTANTAAASSGTGSFGSGTNIQRAMRSTTGGAADSSAPYMAGSPGTPGSAAGSAIEGFGSSEASAGQSQAMREFSQRAASTGSGGQLAMTQIGTLNSANGNFGTSGGRGGRGSGGTYTPGSGSGGYGADGSTRAGSSTGAGAVSKLGQGLEAQAGRGKAGQLRGMQGSDVSSGSQASNVADRRAQGALNEAAGIQGKLAAAKGKTDLSATATGDIYMGGDREGSGLELASSKVSSNTSGTSLGKIASSLGVTKKNPTDTWEARENLRKAREKKVIALFILTLGTALGAAFGITWALNSVPAPWNYVTAGAISAAAIASVVALGVTARKYANADDGAQISKNLYVWLTVAGAALCTAGLAVGWARGMKKLQGTKEAEKQALQKMQETDLGGLRQEGTKNIQSFGEQNQASFQQTKDGLVQKYGNLDGSAQTLKTPSQAFGGQNVSAPSGTPSLVNTPSPSIGQAPSLNSIGQAPTLQNTVAQAASKNAASAATGAVKESLGKQVLNAAKDSLVSSATAAGMGLAKNAVLDPITGEEIKNAEEELEDARESNKGMDYNSKDKTYS